MKWHELFRCLWISMNIKALGKDNQSVKMDLHRICVKLSWFWICNKCLEFLSKMQKINQYKFIPVIHIYLHNFMKYNQIFACYDFEMFNILLQVIWNTCT